MKRRLKGPEALTLRVHLRRALRRAEHTRDYVIQQRDRFERGPVSEAEQEAIGQKLISYGEEYEAGSSVISELLAVLEEGDRALEELAKLADQ